MSYISQIETTRIAKLIRKILTLKENMNKNFPLLTTHKEYNELFHHLDKDLEKCLATLSIILAQIVSL